jgi:sarcosine oxidase subunit beta
MPISKSTVDVVIIGGGIIGNCTAYYLAVRGGVKVTLLERDLLAQGSTGLSVGGIRQQFSHPANIRLSQETVRLFGRFENEFGVDIKFCQAGYLFLAEQKDTWLDFQTSAEVQQRLGVPVELLTPGEIELRWPYLNVQDIVGGTFCSKDGYADPYLVTMGFAAAARRLGVDIRESTEATAILTAGDRVEGVRAGGKFIAAPVIVNAAGPWAAQVGRLAGLDLSVRPFRRQAFMTAPFDELPRPVPMIINQDLSSYFRGADPGLILGMSDPDEPPSTHLNVDRQFMEKVVDAAVHRVPRLERARILRGWAGLYEVTPDDNAIIGEAPSLGGFFCAVGFSGHGFQHGPPVGRILSELILDGRTDFDLTPFAHERFGGKREGEKRVV